MRYTQVLEAYNKRHLPSDFERKVYYTYLSEKDMEVIKKLRRTK